MPRPILFLILGCAFVVGCGSAGRTAGGECFADSECETGFCAANRCLVPDDDEDHDGLANTRERLLGTDPLSADSDRDGKPDGAEVGSAAAPADKDGDGTIDALESSASDKDADCLVDEADARDDTAATAAELSAACPARPGVCAGKVGAGTCALGRLECAVDDPAFQSVEALCDGLDNDCDGDTDEDLAWQGASIGAPCDGTGECGAGVVECRAGLATCSTNPDGSAPGGTPETCNGKDDDCDGDADEALYLDGPDVGPRLGESCLPSADCLPGVVECAGGELVCSTGPGGSGYVGASELCNQLDDDCNGQADEDFPALGDACGTGACAEGHVVCRADLLGVECDTASLATVESCNGQDDDCDGETDEDLDVADSGCPALGVCAAEGAVAADCGTGKWICTAAPDVAYEPGEELSCDGLDNDCDGETDEGFVWSPPDGADALPVGADCGQGACEGGVVTCMLSGAVCTTAALAGPEICNSLDDDCDGATDEDLGGLALGEPCEGVGECGAGVVTCSAVTGLTTCSTDPGGPASGATAEVCNGKDDDCDGAIDQEPDVLVAACVAPGVCAAGGGVPEACTLGTLSCDYAAVPGYEGPAETSCDGADNDCDGLVDEVLAKEPAHGWDKLASGTPPPRFETIAAFEPVGQTIVVTSGGTSLPSPDGPVALPLGDTYGYHLGSETWDELGVGGPPPRAGATLVADPAAKRLVLFGGEAPGAGKLADLWQVDAQAWVWSPLEVGGTAPSPRAGHAAVLDPVSRWMWVIGGAGGWSGKAVAALDLASGKWIAAAPEGPGWRAGTAAACEGGGPGGRIFVFGGEADGGALLGDTWILDLGELGWTPFSAEGGPPPRRDHRLAISGGGLWLFGGLNAKGEPLGDLWRLDLGTLDWELVPLPAGPAPRRSPAFVATEDGIVMLGGSAAGHAFDDAWRLGTGATPAWSHLDTGKLPPPRADAFLTVAPSTGQLLLYGGQRIGIASATTLGDLWARAPDSGAWTLLSASGPARWRAAAAWDPDGERLFVHGGVADDVATPSAAIDVWNGSAWSALDGGPGQPALTDHAAAWDDVGQRMFLYGGTTAAGLDSTTLWSFDPQLKEAPFKPVVTFGEGPGAVHGNVVLVDSMRGRLIALGGAGSQGKVRWLDLESHVWSPPIDVPELASEKPVALLEPTSGRLLVMAAKSAWRLDLDAGTATPWSMTVTPSATVRAAAHFDPFAGRGYLFGGADAVGRTRDALWALPFVCGP